MLVTMLVTNGHVSTKFTNLLFRFFSAAIDSLTAVTKVGIPCGCAGCLRDLHRSTLHTALFHLDKRDTYVIMLFIDYSSAFNTIVPSKLIPKLRALCNRVLDIVTGRPKVVKVGNNTFTTLILNTGAPQGCACLQILYTSVTVLSLLYSLFTHDCVVTHTSNHQVCRRRNSSRPDNNNDETAYREEVRALGKWCQENNLSLNANKTNELIVDFRRQQREHTPNPYRLDRSGGGEKLQVPRCTHH
jgi:hypothetical protein